MNWRCVYLRIDPQGGWMDDGPLFRVGVGLCVRWVDPWTVVDGWISTAQAEAARNASAGGRVGAGRVTAAASACPPLPCRVGSGWARNGAYYRHESTARLSTPPGCFQSTPPLVAVVRVLPRLVALWTRVDRRHKTTKRQACEVCDRWSPRILYGVREKQLAPCTHR